MYSILVIKSNNFIRHQQGVWKALQKYGEPGHVIVLKARLLCKYRYFYTLRMLLIVAQCLSKTEFAAYKIRLMIFSILYSQHGLRIHVYETPIKCSLKWNFKQSTLNNLLY